MRLRTGTALLATALLAAGCEGGPSAGGSADAELETLEQKASYGVGREIGTSLAPASERLEMAAFVRGVEDVMADRESPLPPEELQAALQEFAQEVQADQTARREEEAEANLAEGEEYIAEFSERENVRTTGSGLRYIVVEEGDGPTPGPDDRVRVHYRGTLPDGSEFDSSYSRGEPATFQVEGVIPGFSEILQLMPVGSTYEVVIPSDLAYGEQGSGSIGPNQTLTFEIELLGIEGEGNDGEG